MPVGKDIQFDREEETADICTICTIQTISQQLNPTDAGVLAKESRKDPIISAVSRYTRVGWPQNIMSDQIRHYKKLEDSLSVENGCFVYGARIVIPNKLRHPVLDLTLWSLWDSTDEAIGLFSSVLATHRQRY